MNRGSILLDALISVDICLLIVFMVVNAVSMDFRTNESISSAIGEYEGKIASIYRSGCECEVEECDTMGTGEGQ